MNQTYIYPPYADRPPLEMSNRKHPSALESKGLISPILQRITNFLTSATAQEVEEIDNYIRRHPVKSVLFATLGGIILSKFVRR